jgi:transcription elongation factor GreA
MIKYPMTVSGEQKLRDELTRLKSIERPKVIEAISEARAHGDLKENAEYHAAKEQQGFLEGRIAEIEGKLANSQVIDITKLAQNGRVVFGTTVILLNISTGEEVSYKIVGDDEADIKSGMISVNSPIARAIIGKNEGDAVVVQTPSGEIEYEVSQVNYIS